MTKSLDNSKVSMESHPILFIQEHSSEINYLKQQAGRKTVSSLVVIGV